MNIWSEKTISLANECDYLDQLAKIYPNYVNDSVSLTSEKILQIKNALQESDESMIEFFLNLKKEPINSKITSTKFKFPVKNSYVAYLTMDKNAIKKNPKTISLIAEQIRALDFEDLIKRVTMGAEANRQRGNNFKNWLENGDHGLRVYKPESQISFFNNQGPSVYVAGDANMKQVASEKLGYKNDKGLDFIGRSASGAFYAGEAKWLTDSGGTQDRQFENAMRVLEAPFSTDLEGGVEAIAVLDGLIWSNVTAKRKSSKTIRKLQNNRVVLSALLLPDFLKSN